MNDSSLSVKQLLTRKEFLVRLLLLAGVVVGSSFALRQLGHVATALSKVGHTPFNASAYGAGRY